MMAKFFSLQNWQSLLRSDFNRGYLCALALVAALIVVMMLIRFVLWLIFRERGCSSITIGRNDGDIVVSRSAICSAVEGALKSVPALKVRKLRIFQRRGGCSITLLSSFDGSGSVAELVETVKPLVTGTLRDTFGIGNIRRVKVVIEALESDDEEDGAEHAAPPAVSPVPMPPHGTGTGI